ncbi:hypothetical protein V866_000957 [Kwoniella sp. B9012]
MRIPLELFLSICTILRDDGDYEALAAFQQCSKRCYRVVTPFLYHHLRLTPFRLWHFINQIFDTSAEFEAPLLPRKYEGSDRLGSLVDIDTNKVPDLQVSRPRWIRSLFRYVKEITISEDDGRIYPEPFEFDSLASYARDVLLDTNQHLFPNVNTVNLEPRIGYRSAAVQSLSPFLHAACRPSRLTIDGPSYNADLAAFVNSFEGSVKNAYMMNVSEQNLPAPGTVALQIAYGEAACGKSCPSPRHQDSAYDELLSCRFAKYRRRGNQLLNACISSKTNLDDLKGWEFIEFEGEREVERMWGWFEIGVELLLSGVMDDILEDVDMTLLDEVEINWKRLTAQEKKEVYKRAQKFLRSSKKFVVDM